MLPFKVPNTDNITSAPTSETPTRPSTTEAASVATDFEKLDPASARKTGADAVLPGVEERRYAELLDRGPQRRVGRVVRREGLQARMELEAADAVLLDQAAG